MKLCLLGVSPLNREGSYIIIEVVSKDHVVEPVVFGAVHLED